MRTTLTLDDDVVAKLKAEMRRTNNGLKATVNNLLRLALNTNRGIAPKQRFVVEARDLGDLQPGMSLDNVGALLDSLEHSQSQ